MTVSYMTARDRMQVAAFHAFFKAELLINKESPIVAFAYAIAKSSDMAFEKLSNGAVQKWLDFKGKNNEPAESSQKEINEVVEEGF